MAWGGLELASAAAELSCGSGGPDSCAASGIVAARTISRAETLRDGAGNLITPPWGGLSDRSVSPGDRTVDRLEQGFRGDGLAQVRHGSESSHPLAALRRVVAGDDDDGNV